MSITSWLSAAVCERLVLTFGHFLWQGAVIALVTAIAAFAAKRLSARVRYNLYGCSLVLLVICPMVTFPLISASSGTDASADANGSRSSVPPFIRVPERLPADPVVVHDPSVSWYLGGDSAQSGVMASEIELPGGPRPLVPVVLLTWTAGVMLMLTRLVCGLAGGHRLRNDATPVTDSALLKVFRRQSEALHMQIPPAVAWCRGIALPAVVGALRPVVLIPEAFARGLTTDQVAAVLAHELAHIRRMDHLVIVMQRLAESLLFFHPAVWWVSHRLSIEREHCCDDLVLSLGAQRVPYAAALLTFAERDSSRRRNQLLAPVLVHAARGSRIGERIRRILEPANSPSFRVSTGTTLLAAVIVLLATVGIFATTADRVAAETNGQQDASLARFDSAASVLLNDDSPRETAVRWLQFVQDGQADEAVQLLDTTADVDIPPELFLVTDASISAERAVKSDKRATVVTSAIRLDAGPDRTLVIQLSRNDDQWKISSIEAVDTDAVDDRLRQLLSSEDVQWELRAQDLVGQWQTGPAPIVGVGNIVCGTDLALYADGRCVLHTYDPAGDATESQGTWTLEASRITFIHEPELVSHVLWFSPHELELAGEDAELGVVFRRVEDDADESKVEESPDPPTDENAAQHVPGRNRIVTAEHFPDDHPRSIVQQWLDLLTSGEIAKSFELTTRSAELGEHDAIAKLPNRDQLHVHRSLGNDSVALVISNTLVDAKQQAFAVACRLFATTERG